MMFGYFEDWFWLKGLVLGLRLNPKVVPAKCRVDVMIVPKFLLTSRTSFGLRLNPKLEFGEPCGPGNSELGHDGVLGFRGLGWFRV